MKKRLLFYFCVLLSFNLCAMKAEAGLINPDIPYETVTQQDGITFEVKLKGDEHFNYYVVKDTTDIVVPGENNTWYFGELSKDQTDVVATKEKYQIRQTRSKRLKEKDLEIVTKKINENLQSIQGSRGTALIPEKEQNVLVILLEFENQVFNQDTKEPRDEKGWSDTYFSTKNGYISVANYYTEATGGMIKIKPAKTTQFPEAPGVVKIKLDQKHPNNKLGIDSIVRPSLDCIEKEGYIDFSQYSQKSEDYSKNITLNDLHLVFVVAGGDRGTGSGHTNSILGYKSYSKQVYTSSGFMFENAFMAHGELIYTKDHDKVVGNNSTTSYKSVPSTIGLAAHEFGHELGLKDLYYNSNSRSGGLSDHSLMDRGAYGSRKEVDVDDPTNYIGASPVHLDAYSKMKLGVPVEEVATEKEVDIEDISSKNQKIYKVPVKEDKTGENYYLIENRQGFGFDEGRRDPYNKKRTSTSKGIAIYRINDFYKNVGNVGASVYGEQNVTLIEADEIIKGAPSLEKGTVTGDYAYFKKGQEGLNLFTGDSNPSIKNPDLYPKFMMAVQSELGVKMSVSFIDPTLKHGEFEGVSFTWNETEKILTLGKGSGTTQFNIPKLVEENQIDSKQVQTIVISKPLKLTSAKSLFQNMSALKEIRNIENLDTSKVTDMSLMFSGLSAITTLDLSTFDTSRVTNMAYMFSDLKNLRELDISSFKLAQQKDRIFENIKSLDKIHVNSEFSLRGSAVNSAGVLSNEWTHAEKDIVYSRFAGEYDGSVPGWYERKGISSALEFDEETKTVTVGKGTIGSSFKFKQYEEQLNGAKIHKIKFPDKVQLKNSSTGLFRDLTEVQEIEGLENLDTSKVTDMSLMFSGLSAITTLDLSTFDTSNVTNMAYMFSDLKNLRELDISSFKLAKQKDHIFWNTKSLNKIHVNSEFSLRGEAVNSVGVLSNEWRHVEKDIVYTKFVREYDGSEPGWYERVL